MEMQVRRRILVVDNDDDFLSRLGKELTEAGYDTATTWSGVEALGLLKAARFDSLLVDDYLPDIYIGEFLQELSALQACPRIFVMRLGSQPAFQTHEAPHFTCVDKKRTSKLLQVLAEEDETGLGPQRWTH